MLDWEHPYIVLPLFGAQREKTCLRGFMNNKGADQLWSVPLLFDYWKVSYLNLLQLKFQFSS